MINKRTFCLWTSVLTVLLVVEKSCAQGGGGLPISGHSVLDEHGLAAPPLDYNYDEFTEYNSEKQEDGIIVSKCHCTVVEVLLGTGECQHDERLVEQMKNFPMPFSFSVKDLECSSESALVQIPQHNFQFLDDGSIFISQVNVMVTADSYCVENVIDENTNDIISFGKVCLAAPVIPVCCSAAQRASIKHGTLSSVICNDTLDMVPQVNPDIYFSGNTVKFEKLDSMEVPVHCPPGFEIITATLRNETDVTSLYYGAAGVELRWVDKWGSEVVFTPGKYCLDNIPETITSTEITAYACHQDLMDAHMAACEGHTCVRKCCEKNNVLVENQGCQRIPDVDMWKPQLYAEDQMTITNSINPLKIMHGMPICKNKMFYDLEPESPFILTESGELKVPFHRHLSYPSTQYCADSYVESNGTTRDIALVCFMEEHQEDFTCWWQHIVQLVFIALSCVFILMTIFVYLSVSDILKRLSSKCVVSESIALFLTFICLISLQIQDGSATPFCIATGIILYYSSLASFFWLNIMCIDMYFTLKSFLPVNETSSGNLKWFLRYSAFGWGVPLVFVVVVCVIDNLPVNYDNFNLIRPNIFKTCFFPSNVHEARWAYMFGPILLLLVINTVLFALVAFTVVQQKRELARVLQNKDSQSKVGGGKDGRNACQAKESAMLVLKLFVVMGVTWIADVLSFAVGDSCYVWLVTDIINSLRGFFIFIIFVCKRDVIKKFSAAWRPRVGRMRSTLGVPASKTTSVGSGGRGEGSSSDNRRGKKNADDSSNSSMWRSRKTSTSSLGFLSSIVGGKRKVSTASQNVPELQKMETFKEAEEYEGDKPEEEARLDEIKIEETNSND